MTRFSSVYCTITLTLLTLLPSACAVEPVANVKQDVPGFALIELFTSEGCSSCPPADELLARIVEDSAAHDQPVYALAYHVDYWNRLGWIDKLSDPAYSRRQETYRQALNGRYAYTPQLIVNGTTQMLGSDREAVDKAINAAIARKTETGISLKVDRGNGANLSIHFVVTKPPAGAVVHVAVVEKSRQTQVRHGENAGRTLKHVNIARQLQTMEVPANNAGDIELKLPNGLASKDATIIAFVQTPKDMAIHAAAGANLEPNAKNSRLTAETQSSQRIQEKIMDP